MQVEVTALEWAIIQAWRSLQFGQVVVKVHQGAIPEWEKTESQREPTTAA